MTCLGGERLISVHGTFFIIFLPPVLICLVLTGYDKFICGIETKSERKQLKDYSISEIVYSFFVAIVLVIFCNGFADSSDAKKVTVTVVSKRIQIAKGGGTPLVAFEADNGGTSGILHGIREKK